MNLFLLKLAIMPTVIALITYVSKRWGDSIGGIVASLPWVAGPIIFFIAIERGNDFAVEAIPGVMAGIVSWFIFLVAYIIAGRRYGALPTLGISYAVYFLSGLALNEFIPMLSLHIWYVSALITILLSILYFPTVSYDHRQSEKTLSHELVLRMSAATLFVVVITYSADALGPAWSGILTPFPVMTTILAIFTHYTRGIQVTRQVFMGLMTGSFGFATLFYFIGLMLPGNSIWTIFGFGIMINIALTYTMKLLLQRSGHI
jgi:uncharacterized membrane protein (GlpM family)